MEIFNIYLYIICNIYHIILNIKLYKVFSGIWSTYILRIVDV